MCGKGNQLNSSERFNCHKDSASKSEKANKSSWLFEIVACKIQTVLQGYVT